METANLSRIGKVEKAYVVFLQLQNNGVHELASLAVERVSWGLAELGRMKNQPTISAQEQPTSFARGEVPGCGMDVQGTVGSEAMQTGAMHDTVMGNTGMLLLEDPGLQSFVPEAFAPLTWTLGGEDPTRGLWTHEQVKQEQRHEQKQADGGGDHVLDEKTKSTPLSPGGERAAARSSGKMQGGQGSAPGSAPLRYATFGTAPCHSQEPPQGLTSPTSSFPVGRSTVGQQTKRTEMSPTQPPPPHSRHHSYPSAQHPTILPVADARSYRRQRDDGPRSGMLGSQDGGRDSAWDVDMDMTRFGPRYSTPRPLLQTLSEYAPTSTTAAQPNNPNVHPSWAARPALPISSISEPALNFSQPATGRQPIMDQGQPATPYPQHDIAVHSWQYTLPFNLSTASGESAPATAEQAEVEAWRRFLAGNSTA